jgi:acyl transferase domain-containing protein
VNSFGFGGANSHAVLDDAYHYLKIRGLHANHCTQPRAPAPDEVEIISRRGFSSLELVETYDGSEPVLLTWSAASKLSIEKLTSLLVTHFSGLTGPRRGDTYLKSLAYTLATKRSLLSWRSYAVINSSQELEDFSSIASHPSKSANEVKLAFVFTGQGAQWCGMGRELLVYPVFRDSVERAIEYLRGLGCTWLLADAFTGDGTMDLKIHEPKFSQPICTILQVALVDLLASLGVAPVAVVGHSSGEIAAAYCTGALSRGSAWKLAYYRGVYSQELATSGSGGMMSVGLSEAKVQPYLDSATSSLGNGSLAVACVNSPSNVTISGKRTHLEHLRAQLDEDKVFCRVLLVQVAYHGPLMLQVASQYQRSIADLTPGFTRHGGEVRMISSVTGALISGDELCSSAYWVRNMVSQVKFCQAVQTLCQHHSGQASKKIDLSHRRIIQADYLLEIGPHSTLSGPIRDSLKENSKQVTYGSTLTRNTSAVKTLLEAAGKLHCYGYSMDLLRLNEPHGVSKRTPMILPNLPEYPFDHSRSYWHESRYSRNTRLRVSERNSFIGLPVYDWNPLDCRWRIFLRQSDHAWITDHQVSNPETYGELWLC